VQHSNTGPSRRTLLTATAGAAALTATLTTGTAHAATATSGASGSRHLTDPDLKELISGMTLEEKVGQLFVMRVYGASATDPTQADIDANLNEIGVRTAAELIEKYRVGGIIYFAWAHNTQNPHQIADLSNGIQHAALAQPRGLPLLIATDQEYGIVARVGVPATLMPGAMALGAGGSATDAREAAHIGGTELRAMGIRQDYAPDADVNVNPANPVIGVRSFGADPDAVAAMVAAQVRGYQSAGIASTAKHFPGHGDTATDSHFGFPVIEHSREEWDTLDAPSFRAAVAAGIDSIMTAHIMVPALDDSGDPATLSVPILSGILRGELGYDGVVITDSLGMAGVREKYGDDRVPVLALKAGVDQLLNPPNLDLAWHAVLDAVKGGELTEERLDESILRILRLKVRRDLFTAPYVTHPGVDRAVGTRAHLDAADQIAEHTTTLLVNEGRLLPLSRRTHRRVLVVSADPASPSGTTGPPSTVLARTLTELGFTATALSTGSSGNASQAVIDQAVAAAADVDAVLVGTYNVTATGTQPALVQALAATGVPVITLAIRNPYDAAYVTGAKAVLASYSWTDVELRAAVRVLTGHARPRGHLPVPVPRAGDPATELYPIGYGLSY
jgi:beta-N-acetylhexosaminidase